MTPPSRSACLVERSGCIGVLVALTLLAAACSGSSSGNVIPVDAPAPGVLYVSTASGTMIQEIAPGEGETVATVHVTAPDGSSIVDVGPTGAAGGVHALVQTSVQPLLVSAFEVIDGSLEPVEMAEGTLACLDPNGASTVIAHRVGEGDASGAGFRPVALDGGNAPDLEVTSVVCPRWNADRTVVATAAPARADDPSSTATIVQTIAGDRFEIAFDRCSTTPTGFSPDDTFLALAVTCFAAAWEQSGLYLVPIDDLAGLASITQLGDLDRVSDGLFGRTAWYPDGSWLAAVHADAVEEQNIAQDLSAQPVDLRLVELSTGQTIDLPLADGESPFSLTWLEAPLG